MKRKRRDGRSTPAHQGVPTAGDTDQNPSQWLPEKQRRNDLYAALTHRRTQPCEMEICQTTVWLCISALTFYKYVTAKDERVGWPPQSQWTKLYFVIKSGKKKHQQCLHKHSLFSLENKVSLLNSFTAGFSVFILNKNMRNLSQVSRYKKGTVSVLANFI